MEIGTKILRLIAYLRKAILKTNQSVYTLEKLMLEHDFIGYKPILHEPVSYFLNWLDLKCYRHIICLIIHNIRDPVGKNLLGLIFGKLKSLGELNYQSLDDPDHSEGFIHMAIYCKNYMALKTLIDLDADLYLHWQGKTPLIQAVLDNDILATELLLKAGVDPNFDTFMYDQPLYEVAEQGDNYVTIAEQLLKYGAEVNGKGFRSPIHKAIKCQQSKFRDLLLKYGATVESNILSM